MAEQLTVELLGLHHLVECHPELDAGVLRLAEFLGWQLAGCEWRPSCEPLSELTRRQLAALECKAVPLVGLAGWARRLLETHGCPHVLTMLRRGGVVGIPQPEGAS